MYRLMEKSVEVKYNNRHTIKAGVAIDNMDIEAELVKEFSTIGEARKTLEKYNSNFVLRTNYYDVTEYYIEDDNGDITDMSEFYIEVVGKSDYEVIRTYNNFKEAEEKQFDLIGEVETFLSCK